ncbi:MAG: sialate O-acetylesterase [Pirellulaceae bacterium]|nr:sialate O-acetylesterase [Pirellulaceae bacterium]
MKFVKLLAPLAVVLAASAAWADVKLPKIFGDHMVLQQKTQAPVWGWAEPNEEVTVSLGDEKASTKAGADGKWSVKIATPAAGGPHELKVKGKNEVTLKDVLIGEVWIASGQSNMEWTVAQSANPAEEAKNAQHPQIRMIKVGRNPSDKPQEDFKFVPNPPGAKDLTSGWAVCQPETASQFSACGYYFARKLQKELGVPVGIISTNWGGTIAEAWTSRETLAADQEWFGPILERGAQFKAGNPNQPSVLYNSMIAPLVPFAIKGAIWYQGESNVSRAEQYAKLFPAMIADWRKAWGQGDFPFLFVQLAPYAYNKMADSKQLPELWEAQTKTLTAAPNTGMCVTTDITTTNNIHPPNKQDVGLRLALWALANTYDKKDVAYSGPLYESSAVEGNKVRVKFKHAQGLTAEGGKPLSHFQIAGEDQKFVDAKAEIEGETVVVSSPDVAKPVAVRFGWSDTAEPNLFNGAHLPASPFRTDNFPMVTAGKR